MRKGPELWQGPGDVWRPDDEKGEMEVQRER